VSRPIRKRVSDEVMAKIAAAITEIGNDDQAPRTKREIERRSGLAHDTVARAFRQDAAEDNTWRITAALGALIGSAIRRPAPALQRRLDAEQKAADLRQRLSETEHSLDRYAMALYAYHLTSKVQAPEQSVATSVVPIGRNKPRKRG
jgi:hypothetical protein